MKYLPFIKLKKIGSEFLLNYDFSFTLIIYLHDNYFYLFGSRMIQKKSCTNCVYIIYILKFIYMTTALILHVSKLYIYTYIPGI